MLLLQVNAPGLSNWANLNLIYLPSIYDYAQITSYSNLN